MEQKIKHSDAYAEWLAFDLAADYGVDLASIAEKHLIGRELLDYIVDVILRRGGWPCADSLSQYLKLWHESYGYAYSGDKNIRGRR